MLTKEDLQAIAGLLVPIETRIGNLESRFDKLESRFDNLESRFDKLESRFDKLESRFDSLETRVDNFESETKSRFENLDVYKRQVFHQAPRRELRYRCFLQRFSLPQVCPE